MIKSRYQIPTASPGEMLREEKRRGTALGIAADERTSLGQLLPDDLIVAVVGSWLVGQGEAFLFDGFPRTVGQAEALERLLTDRGKPLQLALSLDATLETLQARVASRLVCSRCGQIVSIGWQVPDATAPCPACHGRLERRRDDTPETLAHRMQEYLAKTAPLGDYYEARGLLARVDAARPAVTVFADIARLLEAE